MQKREMDAYCGDLSQLFYVQDCVLCGGKAKDTRAFEIQAGTDLRLTVLPDKCMTIPRLSFKGYNIGFISKTGICGPQFFQESGTRGFLRNFEAGFMTMCGLTYMGAPDRTGGEENGLHGVISNTPAEQAGYEIIWEGDEPSVIIKGEAREGHLFGPNMIIHKKMIIPVGRNRIEIHDEVENLDFDKWPLMLLYHFNYGYPMLNENCKIMSNYDVIRAREASQQKSMSDIDVFQKPEINFQEIVAFRTMSDPMKQEGKTLVYNPDLHIAVLMKINAKQLPVLNQWKSPRAGDYALGMEPGTTHVGGRSSAEREGLLQWILPGERKRFDIMIEFLDDENEIKKQMHEFDKQASAKE